MAVSQAVPITRHPYADGSYKKMLIDGKWVDAASGNPCERRRVQPDLVEPPRPHRTGRNAFDTGTAELDQRKKIGRASCRERV